MDYPKKCDGSCPLRRVGCRTDCPTWERMEAKKAQRYAKAEAERNANYESRKAYIEYRRNLRDFKKGRKIFV